MIIYDWRYTVQPHSQIFFAGGTAISGGLSTGGALVESPEPGGRAELRMEFDRLAIAGSNLDASWLFSRMLNGQTFRIRLFAPSVQLVTAAALGGTEAGINWDNGLPWDNGLGWAYDPTAPVAVGGAKGSIEVKVNMATYGQVLEIGHVIGFHLDGFDFTHTVMDISYSATNRATIQVSPPLRRQVTSTDDMYFRPTMIATCLNAREAVGNYMHGISTQPGPMRFVEQLV